MSTSTIRLQDSERSFFRQLFLRRYALLLQKVEQTYPTVSNNPELQTRLRERILNLTWVDVGVDRMPHFLEVHAGSGVKVCSE